MTSADDFDVATVDGSEGISYPAEDLMGYGTFEIEDGCVVVEGVHNHAAEQLVVFPDGTDSAIDDDGQPVVRLPDGGLIAMGVEYPLRIGRSGSVADLYGDEEPACRAGKSDGTYVYGVLEDSLFHRFRQRSYVRIAPSTTSAAARPAAADDAFSATHPARRPASRGSRSPVRAATIARATSSASCSTAQPSRLSAMSARAGPGPA